MGQNQHTRKRDLSLDRICPLCGDEVRRIYDDKLCGKCYIKKKRVERLVESRIKDSNE